MIDQVFNLVVYTGGTFDLFHAGHVNFLKRCKEIAGKSGNVIVSLNTDEFIKEYKGKPPIVGFSDRMAVLKACKYVDQVVANSGGADSKPTILEIKPDIIAIGTDWARKDYYKQMQFTQDWLDEKNISLIYIPYTKGISSTEIKQRI
jgi:glycerol-3-phosphate cytidylyltransferase